MDSTVSSTASIQNRRLFYLVFSTITLLILGLIYAWSIFATPIGYDYPAYKEYLPQVFNVSMFAFCASQLFGAFMIKRRSAQFAIIIAAILLFTGFSLTALTASFGFWTLIVFYSILAGSGVGIAYNAILTLVSPWFPDKMGLCAGIQMMGFGISSLVFGSLAHMMFAIAGWRIVFFAIATIGIIIMSIMAFLVPPAPQDIGSQLGLSGTTLDQKESPTKKQVMLRTKVFWLYSFWSTILLATGLSVIGSCSQGAVALGYDPLFGAILVGLVSTMNGIGRIVNGLLFDHLNLVPVMVIGSVIAFVCMTSLTISLSMNIPVLFAGGAILAAFPYGTATVLNAAFPKERFSASDFAKNLGIVLCCSVATAAVLNIIIGIVLGPFYGLDGTIATNTPFAYGFLAFLALVSLVAILVFAPRYHREIKEIAKEQA